MPKVEMIRGLNLPGTPRATSACRGIPLLLLTTLARGNAVNKYFCCFRLDSYNFLYLFTDVSFNDLIANHTTYLTPTGN